MMRFILCLVFLLLLPGAAWAADAFFKAMPDVPLMPGLAERAGDDVSFDQPDGRIAGASASGALSAAAIRDFYQRTLPQLGWRPAGADMFMREGERLRLQFGGGGAATVLQITVEPNAR